CAPSSPSPSRAAATSGESPSCVSWTESTDRKLEAQKRSAAGGGGYARRIDVDVRQDARRGRPGDRAAHPRGDGAAGRRPGANRQRELRLRGGAGGGGLTLDQQVRRGTAREALLRRL